MRHKFDVQLLELMKKIVDMSYLLHKAIENSMVILKNRDLELILFYALSISNQLAYEH